MDLTFTLTPSEVAALQLRFPKHTLEAGFHALMDQYVRADGEARLQSASIRYRELDPDQQLAVTTLVFEWAAANAPVTK